MIGRRILAVPSDSSNWPGQLSCGFASFEGSGHHWACPRTRSTLLAQMALGAGAGACDGVRRTAFTTPSFICPASWPPARQLARSQLPIGATSLISTSCPGPAIGQGGGGEGGSSQRGCPPAGFPRGLPTLHVKARLQRPGMAPFAAWALALLPAGYPSEPLAPLAPHRKRQTSCKAPLSAPARCTLARPQPRSFNGGLIASGIGLSLPHLDSPRPDLTRRFSQRAQQP
jgi:hypothetical protein